MNKLTDCYKLYNGVEIPCVGFGTWQTPDGDVATQSVETALKAGYRHIDTAWAYHNEKSVGLGIRNSGIAREDLFITTKLTNNYHSYELAHQGFAESIADLGLEYVDMYLVHWPNPIATRDHWQQANADAWRAMEELVDAGKIRAIGVSNFRPHHIDQLMQTARIKPAVNQIRQYPGEPDMGETIEYCKRNGILIQAYSPLGTGRIFESEELKSLAEKYSRTPAQICIRWCLQMGYNPLPKSVTPSRIIENADVFGFELSDDDVALLSAMPNCCGETRDPDHTTF